MFTSYVIYSKWKPLTRTIPKMVCIHEFKDFNQEPYFLSFLAYQAKNGNKVIKVTHPSIHSANSLGKISFETADLVNYIFRDALQAYEDLYFHKLCDLVIWVF